MWVDDGPTRRRLRIKGEIWKVLEAESKAGSAKLGGMVKTKLCNVTSGRMWEPHLRPQERLDGRYVERARSERKRTA